METNYELDVLALMKSKLRNFFVDSPNINALLKAISLPIQDRVNVANFILGQYDIDTKEGVFLDQVGSKIGVKRPLAQERDDHLFTLYDDYESADDLDDSTFFGEEGESELGGYFVDDDGLDTGDNATMSDTDYRILLKQKAKLIREKMDDLELYKYMLIFGAPSTIDEYDVLHVVIDPDNDADLSQWERWYIENKGFKPAGIKVEVSNLTGALPI